METAFRSEELFTQAEFRRWTQSRPPSEVERHELVNGRIVMSPPARLGHGVVEANLHRLLGAFVHARRLGVTIGASAGFELPTGDVVAPDFAFVSAERWALAPEARADDLGFVRIVPDLLVEIVTPASVRRDRIEKPLLYAAAGVREYWIVDPARGEVAILGRAGDRFAAPLAATTGTVASSVLPGLQLTVEDLLALPA